MGEYHVASSVEEALEKLSRCEGRAEIVAGGQTMMLLIRQGLVDPDLLVDISKITEIRGIEDVGECIEMMEENGIVSKANHVGKRELL